MNKKHISTEEVKKYNKAFINFMKPSEEETGGEESKFRNGVQKKPDKEINESELKTITKEVKRHE